MEEITDSTKIHKILQEQKQTGGVHDLWIKRSDSVHHFPFLLQKVDLVNQTLWFTINDQVISESSTKVKWGDTLKVYLKNLSTHFYTEVLSYDSKSKLLKVSLPETLFFEERRVEDRFRPEGKIRLGFMESSHNPPDLQNINKSIIDISSGGISILLNKQDVFSCKEGDEVGPAYLVLGKLKVEGLTFKVTKILKIKPFVLENLPYGDRLVSFQLIFNEPFTEKKWQRWWEAAKEKIS